MKLEVGMYVRTKQGVFKIRKITKDLAYWKHEKRVLELDRNIPYYNYRFSFYKDESVFKGAKFKDNIIDLIEVGDYVNGIRVGYINKGEDYLYALTDENTRDVICGYDSDEFTKPLHSIVTKEQFEQMQYKVGE